MDSEVSSQKHPGGVQPGHTSVQRHPAVQYRSYPSRFYVLTVTALLAMHQNVAWLTFSPITNQAKRDYGLTDVELTLLPGIIYI